MCGLFERSKEERKSGKEREKERRWDGSEEGANAA